MVQPRFSSDITGIPAMTRDRRRRRRDNVGACITTGNIEDGRSRTVACHVARSSKSNRISSRTKPRHDRRQRLPCGSGRGLGSVLCALDAECVIAGTNGSRRLPIREFVIGAVRNRAWSAENCWRRFKIPRLSTDQDAGAMSSSAVDRRISHGDRCGALRPARERYRSLLGRTNGRPIVVDDARLLV